MEISSAFYSFFLQDRKKLFIVSHGFQWFLLMTNVPAFTQTVALNCVIMLKRLSVFNQVSIPALLTYLKIETAFLKTDAHCNVTNTLK